MRVADITTFNQEYKGFILVENSEELESYIKKVLNGNPLSKFPGYRTNLREAIDSGESLVFNPYNDVSYFTLPKTAIIKNIRDNEA